MSTVKRKAYDKFIKEDAKVLRLKVASFNFWMACKAGRRASAMQEQCFIELIGEHVIGSDYDQQDMFVQAVNKAAGL